MYRITKTSECVNDRCMKWDFGIECKDQSHQQTFRNVFDQNKKIGYSFEHNGKFVTYSDNGCHLGNYNAANKADEVIIAYSELREKELKVIETSVHRLNYSLFEEFINLLDKYFNIYDYYGHGNIEREYVKGRIFEAVELRIIPF